MLGIWLIVVASLGWLALLSGGVQDNDEGEGTGYLANVAQLEAARTSRTKLLVFVSPSNPAGAVYPREQASATWHRRPPSPRCPVISPR